MKKLLIMFGKTLGLASAITLFAAVSSANAAVIDFTRSPLGSSGTDGGIGWTLSVVMGTTLNNSELQNGSTCVGLSCVTDGIGIGDDEIGILTGDPGSREVLLLAFNQPVNVSRLMFLDLFDNSSVDGGSLERAYVGTDGSTYPFTFDATEGPSPGPSGFLNADVTGVAGLQNITALYFTAFLPNLDDNSNDYALAGVNVSAVPLPASLPLFASGLGLLGYARWRKRKKAKRA